MMKKMLMASVFACTLLLMGCGQSTPGAVTQPVASAPSLLAHFTLITGETTHYPYTWKMDKPELTAMNNRDALQHGFHDVWKTIFAVSGAVDFSNTGMADTCSGGFTLVNNDNGKELKKISFKDFWKDTTFTVSDKYTGPGLGLTFSSAQKDFLGQHGWILFKANSGFIQDMIKQTTYEGDGTEEDNGGDERADNYNRIGGSSLEYKRYPYDTVFVSSDLLLHVYHRLFDNSLKYYEESTARPMVSDLAQSLFAKFSGLAKTASDPTLKKNYEFLAAYRSLPYAILIPNSEMIAKITTNTDNSSPEPDLSDKQVKDMIIARQKSILSQLTPDYQKAVQSTLTDILAADKSDGGNVLLETLSPDLLKNFGSMDALKFDFTQFTPRAHYTTDSLLKTYFMGMKWLMREKLFFADTNVAAASLVMVNNIKSSDLTHFNDFYSFIQRLIGEDDDVNISDLQGFISQQGWSSDTQILQGFTSDLQKKLMTLRPQKIMSVSYLTPTVGATTEQAAKDQTAGFIFFGEKFTVDSWFFDQYTAGSAETEASYKPQVQSALMVADTFLNTPTTTRFAKLWLTTFAQRFGITPDQIAGYDKVKADVQKNNILTSFDFGTTLYHTWLHMIGLLFMPGGTNTPYFMLDPLYQDKLLTTYLGSYTELKHDTLLYIKQAYAEMGAGGGDDCTFGVYPPALPIPKGYVEPNIDVIDQLISLTHETSSFFTGDAYTTFGEYLTLVKRIAVAQTKNEKISDEDFDALRLSYNTLTEITTPQKLFGQPLQKERRGSIIADIFTSGKYGPLYEAVGRPYLMALMVNDVNGARVVLGPVFSQYEFYAEQVPFQPTAGRFNDQDRQNNYDGLSKPVETSVMALPFQEILKAITK